MRKRILLTILLALAGLVSLPAQNKTEQKDSLVRLLSSQNFYQDIDSSGETYREVSGEARFLHNNTFLLCDTALWRVDRQIIEAVGHVRILQEQTVLSGDKLTYYIERDLAEFRGSVVQLEDKDHNMLRTRHLDYNTKDSLAIFLGGGAMKDKDGQIIESEAGTYDAKSKIFTFAGKVNMFTDSVFIRTSRMVYDTDRNMATFDQNIDAWKDDDMLSSQAGWYDRNRELFFFRNRVHGMTPDQEVWTDSLYFWRNTRNVEMQGVSQLTDTTRNVFALARRMEYVDSLSRMVLTRDAAVVGITQEKGAPKDTVYFGGDSLIYRTVPMCDVSEAAVGNAKKRLDDLALDAVANYRKEAAEAAEKARQEALQNNPELMQNQPPAAAAQQPPAGFEVPEEEPEEDLVPPADSTLQAPLDSLGRALTDTLSSALTDSLSLAPPDSTKIGFLTALGNVRMFRSDIQMACDSLVYTDLDSLVRMYRDPVVWNDGNRQYSADSLYAVIKDRALEKASLMSNAFIIIEEEPDKCYDQIRSTEMLAYFDGEGGLRRFDALGEASAIFYLKEDSTFATVNKSQAKMLYAQFRDGDIDRVYYFDQVQNDASPLAQMKQDDRVLKGFNWLPDRRPKSKEDITPLSLRPSERKSYESRPKAEFKETDIYYPGYMSGVYKKIREQEAAKARRRQEQEAAKAREDSLRLQDSLSIADTLADAVLPPVDSLAGETPVLPAADSLASPAIPVATDSVAVRDSVAEPVVLDAAALKKAEREAARAEREAARAARQAAKEARWARLDSLDAAKAKVKADKAATKLRQKKLKALQAAERQERKDQAKLERYRRKYEARKAREEERKRKKEASAAAEALKDEKPE